MQSGVHVIERAQLAALNDYVNFESDWMGIIDLSRMIEGRLDEPNAGEPLGVIGLETLLGACVEKPDDVMRRIRTTLHGGKEYFEWKKIPVAFLTRGSLDYSSNDGLTLSYRDEKWSLTPLLGKNFSAAHPEQTGWWHTPQFG